MDTRRSFLSVVASSSVGMTLLGRDASAETAAPASPPPAAPSPAASSAAPSAIALATARGMRGFDPKLTDDDILTIARRIDEQRALGAQLAPKKKPLRNDVGPLTVVRLAEPAP